jgi:hypothetical protein
MIKKKNVMKLPNPDIPRENCVMACEGCDKQYGFEKGKSDGVCIAYISPRAMHRRGCPLKSNKDKIVEEQKKINPLKWSKRKNKR